MPEIESPAALTLFPLNSVLFPGGLLTLKVFEARYLELIKHCMRTAQPFGVVLKPPGGAMETIGTIAEIIEVEATTPCIVQARCRGAQRFEMVSQTQSGNGLWQAQIHPRSDDTPMLPSRKLISTARALASAIANLKQQGSHPFLKPFQFDNAGWVANRWCEILPISNIAKQQLLALPDPMARLQLVGDFLRGQGVVG
jgi:uncharacterized protein